MAYRLYGNSALLVQFPIYYVGPGETIIVWFAIVDGNGNVVPGPDGNHQATGAKAYYASNGQQAVVGAGMQNNGSIPSGQYGLACRVFNSTWSVLYAAYDFPVGTIVV